MNEKRSLIKTIWDRKKNWIGHVVRGDDLMKLVLEGRMVEKRPRGRPRMDMIDDVLDETYVDMKRKAENRELENLEAKDLPLGRELMMMMIIINIFKKVAKRRYRHKTLYYPHQSETSSRQEITCVEQNPPTQT